MYKLNIRPLVDAQFANKNQFAIAIGLQYDAVLRLYKGTQSSITFEMLTKLCDTLQCSPNDILRRYDEDGIPCDDRNPPIKPIHERLEENQQQQEFLQQLAMIADMTNQLQKRATSLVENISDNTFYHTVHTESDGTK